MTLYIVQVMHRIANGTPFTEPVLVTGNPAVALTAAFGTEEKGYRFIAVGDGAQVYRLENDRWMRSAEPFVTKDGLAAPASLVFSRVRYEGAPGGWLVDWLDPEMERTYRKIFDSLPVPA